MRKGGLSAGRAICIGVLWLFVAWLAADAKAQNTQEPSTFPCYVRIEGCVRAEYDRFKDKTFVTMTPVQLTGYSSSVSLALGAEFSSPGRAVKRPEVVTLKFIAFALSSNPFADERGVYLLIDGKPYPLGDLSLEKESSRDYESRYSLQATFDVVEKIASAKMAEIRVGSKETTLDEKVKAPFQRFIELVPKEERAVSPAVEKAVPREVKRPKPARTPRRGRP